MIFWDVGGAIFIARTVFKDPRLDLRVLALGAVLPNLIDKLLGSVIAVDHFRAHRLYAHTILFTGLALVAVLVITRRGSDARRSWMMLPFGVATHLILDIPLEAATLWWPFLGFDFPADEPSALGPLLTGRLSRPLVVAQELAGLAYLLYLANKGNLRQSENRQLLVRTGRLVA